MTPVPAAAPTALAPAPPASAPPSSPSWGSRWFRAATHPGTSAGLLVLALGLMGWSVFVRMPRLAAPLIVQARELSGAGSHASGDAVPVTVETLAALQARAVEARRFLVPRREDILPVMRTMERLAEAQGWRLEATLAPAQAAPPGLEMLQRHPATVTLQNLPLAASAPPAYYRLATLLRQYSQLDQKVDLVRLEVKRGSGGVITAALEFHFWTPNPHAQAAPK